MVAGQYLKQLQRAYQIEVLGEVVCATALRLSRNPNQRERWEVLMRLEGQTWRRIESAMSSQNVVRPKRSAFCLSGILGGLLAILPWRIAMRLVRAGATHGINFWQQLAREHSGQDDLLHEYLIAHEQAQMDFARCEIEGKRNESLQHIYRLLET